MSGINFTGKALKLRPSDVVTVAGYLGVEIAILRAVMAVESRNTGFGPEGRPIILNEPHVFYRELPNGPLRAEAIKQGLAYKSQGTKPYPKTQEARYIWLAKAMAIDETAALRSCSWGLGQVMGFNHEAAGFDTVEEFVSAMTYSEGAQLYAVARFIVTNGLQVKLRNKDWRGFAYGYNGKNYAAGGYHTNLSKAYYKRPASERIVPPPASENDIQALLGLTAAKADVPVDPATTTAARPVVVVAEGPKEGETTVVVTKVGQTKDTAQQAPQQKVNKSGWAVILAILSGLAAGVYRYFGEQ